MILEWGRKASNLVFLETSHTYLSRLRPETVYLGQFHDWLNEQSKYKQPVKPIPKHTHGDNVIAHTKDTQRLHNNNNKNYLIFSLFSSLHTTERTNERTNRTIQIMPRDIISISDTFATRSARLSQCEKSRRHWIGSICTVRYRRKRSTESGARIR